MLTKDLIDAASIFEGPINKLLSFLGKEVQHTFSNRILEYQREEYERNYFTKTFISRNVPIPLVEFYQPLFLEFEKDNEIHRISTTSVKELLSKWPCITIIGSAGSGKSTILKYLFINCFEERFKIPIKVELRHLNEYQGSFNDYLFNEVFKFQKIGISDNIVDRLLNSDNFLFFLDGYDEINSKIKAQAIQDINSFVIKYPNNKYVITSRPYSNIELLPKFINLRVSKLRNDEIVYFVKKQLPKRDRLADRIINSINEEKELCLLNFLRNPFVTFIVYFTI